MERPEATGEGDLEALAIPSAVKAAGATLAVGGAFFVVTGLQALGFGMRGPLTLVGPCAIALGIADVAFAAGVARARLAAARGAVVLAALTSLLALGWSVFALANGVLSLIAVSVVPISALAACLVMISMKPIQRVDAARTRLRAQGLDAGF